MRFIKFVLLPLVTAIIGVIIGIIVRDFPLFTLNYNLKITEVLTVITTFSVGIFVPLIVKKLIDDNRSFRNTLIDESNNFIKTAERLDDRINELYSSKKLLQRDKEYINLLFEISDEEFNLLYSFLEQYCNSKAKGHLENLKNKWIEYWKILTGSEMTSKSITKIDDSTFKKATKTFSEIKSIVRNIKIHLNDS